MDPAVRVHVLVSVHVLEALAHLVPEALEPPVAYRHRQVKLLARLVQADHRVAAVVSNIRRPKKAR